MLPLQGKCTARFVAQPSNCSGSFSNCDFLSNYCLYSKHRHEGKYSVTDHGGRGSAATGAPGRWAARTAELQDAPRPRPTHWLPLHPRLRHKSTFTDGVPAARVSRAQLRVKGPQALMPGAEQGSQG